LPFALPFEAMLDIHVSLRHTLSLDRLDQRVLPLASLKVVRDYGHTGAGGTTWRDAVSLVLSWLLSLLILGDMEIQIAMVACLNPFLERSFPTLGIPFVVGGFYAEVSCLV
jgi:hypothetical protein